MKRVTEYILALSYGKDSCACPHVIRDVLGWPLDGAVHSEVWATDTIPADLPPMVEFKSEADAIFLERWDMPVTHLCAMRDGEKMTFEKGFYHVPSRRSQSVQVERESWAGRPNGWPLQRGSWCKHLKIDLGVAQSLRRVVPRPKTGAESGAFSTGPVAQGAKKDIVQYLGIAADEPERIKKHINRPGIKLPLVEAGWTEAMCREWCEKNGLLSPIYTTATRGGCWFCHNQGVQQLRLLRKNYQELWSLLLKWDADSPQTFKAPSKGEKRGRTVHDFDRHFQLEDEGLLAPGDKRFRWEQLDGDLQYTLFGG